MSVALGQLEPLPSGIYTGTMASADIYPTHRGIGGVRTQDRALPAYADSIVQAAERTHAATHLDRGLLGTPAGWLVLILVGLVVGAWVIK
jgi:hypothetical protein